MATENDPRHELGRKGEQLAERFLKKRGLKTLARRFSTPLGEIDLVMRDGRTIVFVEVKTLTNRTHSDPQDALRPAQQRRIRRTAEFFLRDKRLEDRPCRIDLIGVTLPPNAEPVIDHFENAFA